MADGDEEELNLLRELDSTLQERSTQLINTIKSESDGAPSLDSLIVVIRSLGDTNQDVVKVLLRSKDDIHGSRELLELLSLYFRCSHKTLDFLNILEPWLHGVSWRLDRVKSALKEFKADNTKTGYGRTLLQRALSGFAQASDPLVAQRLNATLAAVLEEQTRLYDRLPAKKHELDVQVLKNDLVLLGQEAVVQDRRFKLYRKVLTLIQASLYYGLLVYVFLSPAAAFTPIVAIAGKAVKNQIQYKLDQWMDHMWRKYEDRLRRRTELVKGLMKERSQITVEDLEGIRVAVQALQDKFQRFSVNAGSTVALRQDPVVKSMVDDMERKIDGFSRAIKDLQAEKEKCYKDVKDARAKMCGTTFS